MPRHNTHAGHGSSESGGAGNGRKVVRIGVFSSDPAACDAFHAMDPESGIIYPAINDSLVYIDTEGVVRPGLATAWRRVDPLTMELDLREGVRFHNGDTLSADDVVATIRAQRDPANRAPNGQGILSVIKACEKVHDYRVRLTTYMPDGMLLYRLHIASAVYPRSILESKGPEYFLEHPIGTGGYVFERWDRGQEIVLSRNPEHWSGLVTVDELRFPIIDQKDWVDALLARQLDIALNLDPHDAMRVMGNGSLVVQHREAALSHWFLLSNKGPLADRRVRLALNYAVHRHLLCNIANHGWASPQASLLTPGQVGYDDSIAPYPYDPDYAIQLLAEAGYPSGFTLRGLVSESSSSLYQLVRVFLAKIGVQLEAEIVPRPRWLYEIVSARVMENKPFLGDFALANIDNFTLHGLFHHSIFLFSEGVFSLMSSPDYDARFLDTAVQVEPEKMDASLRALDRYAYDEGLLLFTMRQQVFCGMRKGYHIPIGLSGHFNFDNLWRIRVDDDALAEEPVPIPARVQTEDEEMTRLLDATVYPGILYDTGPYQDAILRALWRNVELHEIRWKIQTEKMLHTLVDQVAASTHLDNVLRSTKQVAILGVTYTGRVLFENSGYANVMGHPSSVPLSKLLFDDDGKPAWEHVMAVTDRDGLYSGVFNVPGGLVDRRRMFLTVTPAINENGSIIGYVCIGSDHAREEERLRIRQEMELAQRIQVALLPTVSARDKDNVAAVMIPADEVGGDYYDIITDDDGHVWYGVGDVSGHGVTSGLIMLMSHCIIRTIIRANPRLSMSETLAILNRVLYDDIQQLGESYHLTLALLKSVGNGDYVAAGAHEDIIVYRAATGVCERVGLNGMWVGLMPDIRAYCEEVRIHLNPGDTMVLYTDGILEATAADGSMWEGDRFISSIMRHASLPPAAMKDAILEEVTEFMGEQFDDITMMIIRRPARA